MLDKHPSPFRKQDGGNSYCSQAGQDLCGGSGSRQGEFRKSDWQRSTPKGSASGLAECENVRQCKWRIDYSFQSAGYEDYGYFPSQNRRSERTGCDFTPRCGLMSRTKMAKFAKLLVSAGGRRSRSLHGQLLVIRVTRHLSHHQCTRTTAFGSTVISLRRATSSDVPPS